MPIAHTLGKMTAEAFAQAQRNPGATMCAHVGTLTRLRDHAMTDGLARIAMAPVEGATTLELGSEGREARDTIARGAVRRIIGTREAKSAPWAIKAIVLTSGMSGMDIESAALVNVVTKSGRVPDTTLTRIAPIKARAVLGKADPHAHGTESERPGRTGDGDSVADAGKINDGKDSEAQGHALVEAPGGNTRRGSV